MNAADSRLFAPPHADATTAAAWTTTPKSASCLRSLRSAISARALTTWLPAAQSKHSSPRRVLRESRLPPEETKKSMATRRRLATAPIRRETGKVGTPGEAEANQTASMERWEITIPVHPSRLLLELPQVKTFFCCFFFLLMKKFFVCLFVIWCNTQEYCCIIALRTLS